MHATGITGRFLSIFVCVLGIGANSFAEPNSTAKDIADQLTDQLTDLLIAPAYTLQPAPNYRVTPTVISDLYPNTLLDAYPRLQYGTGNKGLALNGVSVRLAPQNGFMDEILNLSLGFAITPIDGLVVNADFWRFEINENRVKDENLRLSADTATPLTALLSGSQNLTMESVLNQLALMGNSDISFGDMTSTGIDLSASYMWNSKKYGQFVVSTKSTYVRGVDYERMEQNIGSDLLSRIVAGDNIIGITPELKSSLALSWRIGNHIATATTHHLESLSPIGQVSSKEAEIARKLTTFDFLYGYKIKIQDRDRAVIAIGIRNVFDKKPLQDQEKNDFLTGQNGRMAYGTIKYRF